MKVERSDRIIYVQLPNKLFKRLEEIISEHEKAGETPKLRLAPAAYLAYQILERPFHQKDICEDGWVPFCSKVYNDILHFSKYMKLLLDNKLIERHKKNYSTESNECYRYRLAESYRKQVVKPIEVPAHKLFAKGRKNNVQERMERAKETTPHLTKWLNPEDFQVEYDSALEYIKETYRGAKNLERKNHRIMALEKLRTREWGFSRQGADNRLHSLLTSLPTDLKRYITYKQQPLVSLDIKNSQPFIFSTIINNLILKKNHHFGTLTDILERSTKVERNKPRCITNSFPNKILMYHYKELSISTMFDSFDSFSIDGSLERFVKEVSEGEFYEIYGEMIWNDCLLNMNSCGEYFLTETSKKGLKNNRYETLRKAAKDITMKTLFGSRKSTKNYIKVFEQNYPQVFQIMKMIKNYKPEQENFLPVLLQNIEADCILDYSTKLISEKYPEIPLFTIHDSIVTTSDNIEILKKEFRRYLRKYFGIVPELKIEPWCEDSGLAA